MRALAIWPWRFSITGNLKSQEGFYPRLHAQLIRCDPLNAYSSDTKSLNRDLLTLQLRVSNEGLAFLTKSLPKLGKSFDQGLASGWFKVPLGFKKSSKNPSIPAFMQAYFNQVFNEYGMLRDVVPVMAICHIRQVLYFAYKLDLPYSATENSLVIENFIATDRGLEIEDSPLANNVISLAKIITQKVYHDFDHKDIRPRHGPGAVATGERLDAKWKFSRLYDSIHQVYPYYNYYVVGGARELADRLDWYKSLVRLKTGCAKVVLVPKDSRGPRLISCEPLEYQWIQQGLGRKLSHFLERYSPYTRGNVNFTNQEINGNIAKSSSADQSFATLDLKDASDRVSLELVRRIFSDSPGLLRALEASRTTDTKLPDGRVITLRKYAPMGSALCFPVEAYLFWVIIVSAVIHAKNLPLQRVGKKIYIYGDDIIVPTEWALLSIQGLEAVGLKVNIDKSYFKGSFRESCGIEAFRGDDVTPYRLKKPWSGQNTDGSALLSYIALANHMDQSGYKLVAAFLWGELESTYGKIPFGTTRSSFPCKVVKDALQAETLNRSNFAMRFNQNFQRLEFSVKYVSPRRMKTKLDGWPRMLRDNLSLPFGDPSVVVLPLSTKIKRGWTSIA